MKKLTALFLALVLCLSLCTVAFAAVTLPDGAEWIDGTGTVPVWYKLTDSNTVLTIGGEGAMPNCAEDGARQPWKDNRASITSLFIESGVTSIGYNAFSGCTSLASVNIPNSVTSIEDSAFNRCTSLASVNIPASVTNIGGYAFRNTGLTSVTILKNVLYGTFVYSECASLTNVTISSGVTSISNQAFYNCKALKNITIPDSVTSIGSAAFAASGLNSITIPASVTEIKNNAFYSCSSLADVTMGATTPPTLGTDVFKSCNSNLKIHVPAGTKTAYRTAANWISYQDKIFPVYDLAIASMEHGTVTATPTDVASGTDVTLTVTPENGYKLASLTVTKQSGDTVAVTGNKFTMPNENVTVTAVFEKENSGTGGGNHHHHGGTATVQSAKTADMGVALYGVLTVSSLLGMGWVSKKKH